MRLVLLLLVAVSSALAQTNATDIVEKIQSVCPIDGVSIGRPADKSTWRVDYKPEATPEQKAAAQQIIANWTQRDFGRRDRIEKLITLHLKAMAIEREIAQSPASAAVLQSVWDTTQADIEALRTEVQR